LPLILGSELAGIVEGIGADVSGFKLSDEVYGATNEQFSGYMPNIVCLSTSVWDGDGDGDIFHLERNQVAHYFRFQER
jgi:NADPH:quinone reductase-like Zn-dependent oxidoreductase